MKLSRFEIIKYSTLLILFFLIFFLIFWPNYKKLLDVNKKFSDKVSALQKLSSSSENNEKYLADLEALNSQLPDFNQIFYKEGEELSLVTELEKISSDHNIGNQAIKFGSEKTKFDDHLKKLTIELSFNCNYSDFIAYLNELKTNNYKIIIQNINTKRSNKSQIEVILTGSTYWYIP
jgi:hypothetical protein